MKVIIYVEGPSDQLSMEALFRSLIAKKLEEGKAITFSPAPTGNKKKMLLTKVPANAVDILRGNAEAQVVALPDLYPPNVGFEHRTFDELQAGIYACFEQELKRRKIDDVRLKERFHVFCYKHDLEALLLASEAALLRELRLDRFTREDRVWTVPVEDQNHDNPPKRVVEALFTRHGRTYHDTDVAPRILGAMSYQVVAERCPQRFQPFVEFLEGL